MSALPDDEHEITIEEGHACQPAQLARRALRGRSTQQTTQFVHVR
jgi:hypothetical protein